MDDGDIRQVYVRTAQSAGATTRACTLGDNARAADRPSAIYRLPTVTQPLVASPHDKTPTKRITYKQDVHCYFRRIIASVSSATSTIVPFLTSRNAAQLYVINQAINRSIYDAKRQSSPQIQIYTDYDRNTVENKKKLLIQGTIK